MGTPAPNATSGRSWERAATRAAILAAARRVAERDSVLDLSLTSVAKEAGFAPTSVYAYFTSKNDLLLAVIADDLATLARAMRDALGYGAEAEPEPAPQPLPAEPAPLKPATPALSIVAAPEESAPEPETPPAAETTQSDEPHSPAEPPEPAPIVRRIPVVEPRQARTAEEAPNSAAEAIAQLQETVAKLETRQVDAWLERRLREFERALAALEGRQVDRSTADGTLDARLREFQANLDALENRQRAAVDDAQRTVMLRLETSEKKTREHASDLESQLAEFANRLTQLENMAFAAGVAPLAAADPVQAKEALPAPAEDLRLGPAKSQRPKSAPPADGPQAESYLSAARRSAQAAAIAQEDTSRPRRRRLSRTTIAVFVGCLVLVLLLAGLSIFLRARAMMQEPIRVTALPAKTVVLSHRATAARAPTAPSPAAPTLAALATAGNADAELLVGLAYLDGNGAAKDPAQAAAWLTRAAGQGQAVAQYHLATLYQDGTGVARDPVQAFHWFQAAAAKGNRKAMHSLAVAYAEGWGTSKNLALAAKWFARAANQGFVNAEFNLAVLDERGLGVPQSLTEAYKWYAIAAARGDHESQARVAALASQLPGADLAKAKQAADAFKPQPLDPASNLLPRVGQQASAE